VLPAAAVVCRRDLRVGVAADRVPVRESAMAQPEAVQAVAAASRGWPLPSGQ
jgi:hypothetical protein